MHVKHKMFYERFYRQPQKKLEYLGAIFFMIWLVTQHLTDTLSDIFAKM